jgi:cellobiose phosphorylase
MKFGYFDSDEREYVISDPRTPVKWINYIGTRDFGGFVDHTGGALICKGDPSFNRITKYVQQMPASDFKGTTLYVRLHTAAGYEVFSPFFVPTLHPLDLFECRVGLGYSRIVSEFMGIRCEVLIFVPEGQSCEIRSIEITNLTGQAVTLDVIPLVEYTHPNAMQQFTNADWIPQTMQSWMTEEEGYTVLWQAPFMNIERQMNYLTSNMAVQSFETDRKLFLGEQEYGSFRRPLSLEKPQLSNTQARRGDNIGALLHEMKDLKAGETRRLILQFGQTSTTEADKATRAKYRDAAVVDAEFAKLKRFWDTYLDALQVQTPDEDMNRMVNIHNPYQCYVTKTWSRYLSYYQLGMGLRGIGMRDSSQDVMGVLSAVPDEGKALLKLLLSFQKREGNAYHQFNPFTMEGHEGDSLEMEDRPHYYSDDHLWGVLAVCAYVKETGDLAFLEEHIPFNDKDKNGMVLEEATVLEHMKRGLRFTAQDTGAHGLPLLGFADWNDTVNLPRGAESVFTANLYGKALLEMIEILSYLGEESDAAEFQAAYRRMQASVEEEAWDGAWYVRYFDDQGKPLGSHDNRYGQIYLNAQSWGVISGYASAERGHQAMASVQRLLNTQHGIKLSTPGFNGYDAHYGGVTTYPPGAKENGGIFLHTNPWAMIAETMLGNGDRAYDYYRQINPVSKNDSIETYECEPYVYAQNILGNEHPQFGLGRNSWLSGTASWCYQAATQWILGVRPAVEGLKIDPCIPSEWDGFSVARRFRGQKVRIRVHNPGHVCKGVKRMTVNGAEIDGNIVPLAHGEQAVEVEVWLGGGKH